MALLRDVTNQMDEAEVTTGSRYLFITPTLKGVLDDYSLANPTMSNRVLQRFSKVVEVPQTRFYTHIDLLSGGDEGTRVRACSRVPTSQRPTPRWIPQPTRSRARSTRRLTARPRTA